MMEYRGSNLLFDLDCKDCKQSRATITIPLPLVNGMYQQVLLEQKKHLKTEGFAKGTIPLSYIEKAFKNIIVDHLKEFFFNHCVINFLCQNLQSKNIVIVGEPQLVGMHLEPSQGAQFTFSFTPLERPHKNDWKHYNFKAPARKNYKDLDRQVTTFLKEENLLYNDYKPEQGVQQNDWIRINIEVLDDTHHALLADYSNSVWMRIGKEDADKDAHALFLGHSVGDSFITRNNFLQRCLSNTFDTNYNFKITLLEHIPHCYFSIDRFKYHFGIKTTKELNLKLVEVFSYRNDISQRRETAEAALRTIINYYKIEIPEWHIEQQKTMVLKAVRTNPDYHVYRGQKDFARKVHMLAEKQLKEAAVVDYIAAQERISINHQDVAAYLNLFLRPRTKEFVYFDLLPTQMNGQEQPIPAGIINQACLREKTLNYIIKNLTS